MPPHPEAGESFVIFASGDTLCNHSVGAWLEMYPDGVKRLPAWAASENRWMKRAAAVSLILPARQGVFLETVFGLVDQLSDDPDDPVQKGYGWIPRPIPGTYSTR